MGELERVLKRHKKGAIDKSRLSIVAVLLLLLMSNFGGVAAQASITLTISRWAGPCAVDQIEVIKQFE